MYALHSCFEHNIAYTAFIPHLDIVYNGYFETAMEFILITFCILILYKCNLSLNYCHNLSKFSISPIRFTQHLQLIAAELHCAVNDFPCIYLGLPLSVRKLRKVDFQPLIGKVADRLPF